MDCMQISFEDVEVTNNGIECKIWFEEEKIGHIEDGVFYAGPNIYFDMPTMEIIVNLYKDTMELYGFI